MEDRGGGKGRGEGGNHVEESRRLRRKGRSIQLDLCLR